MPEKFKNGWKVIIPYTRSVLDLLFNQQVFMDKSVRMDTLGGPFLKNHLLYQVDGNAEWISVAKKYGIDHVSNKSGLGKVGFNLKDFRSCVKKLPLPPATGYEICRKHRDKISNIYFIQIFGPSVRGGNKNYLESNLDSEMEDKSNEQSSNYLLSSNLSVMFDNSMSEIRSFQMKIMYPNSVMSLCRNVLDKLILTNIDSQDGISIVSEQPMGNGLMMNISRPGVLRQYYGLDVGEREGNTIKRATYGFNSSVGTDPNKFITKPFDSNLIGISNLIMNKLRNHNNGELCKKMNLNTVFNSCTVLPYTSIPGIKKHRLWVGIVMLNILLMVYFKHKKTHKYKTPLLL